MQHHLVRSRPWSAFGLSCYGHTPIRIPYEALVPGPRTTAWRLFTASTATRYRGKCQPNRYLRSGQELRTGCHEMPWESFFQTPLKSWGRSHRSPFICCVILVKGHVPKLWFFVLIKTASLRVAGKYKFWRKIARMEIHFAAASRSL